MDIHTLIGIIATLVVILLLTTLLIWSIHSINRLNKAHKTLHEIITDKKIKGRCNGRSGN